MTSSCKSSICISNQFSIFFFPKGLCLNPSTNVLSPDHTFTDGLRQRPLGKKKIQTWLDIDIDDLQDEVKRNYQRNDKLINLENVPEELESEIMVNFREASSGDRSKLLNYFIKNKLKELTENIGEF